ncbi:MAG: response regulator [Bacteroidetes bacterium]|nr:response regulator [Bacteroidota bacterium]
MYFYPQKPNRRKKSRKHKSLRPTLLNNPELTFIFAHLFETQDKTLLRLMMSDPIYAMLADDSPDEHFLFIHTVKGIDKSITVSTAVNGEDLLNKLSKASDLPHIIFLDINMPFKNGKESLHDMRQDLRLRDIPVVIYSTSDEKSDIEDTFALGADMYLKKPQDFIELEDILKGLFKLYREQGFHRGDRDRYIFKLPDHHI